MSATTSDGSGHPRSAGTRYACDRFSWIHVRSAELKYSQGPQHMNGMWSASAGGELCVFAAPISIIDGDLFRRAAELDCVISGQERLSRVESNPSGLSNPQARCLTAAKRREIRNALLHGWSRELEQNRMASAQLLDCTKVDKTWRNDIRRWKNIRTFPWTYSPKIFLAQFLLPFYMVQNILFPPPPSAHPPDYNIKRSTVNVYNVIIDRGRSVRVRSTG